MPTINLPPPPENASLEQLNSYLVRMVRDFNYLLNGQLDSNNAREFGGWIIGDTTITSSSTEYPRVSLNSTGNLVQGLSAAGDYISLNAENSVFTSHPTLQFISTGMDTFMGHFGTDFTINTGSGLLFACSTGDASLYSNTGNVVLQSDAGDINITAAAGDLGLESAAGIIVDAVTEINGKAPLGLAGPTTIWASTSSGGTITRQFTFTAGVLVSSST